jgi:DNA modification methylase
MTWEVLTGDCLEIIPTLSGVAIDAVITDPVYGIGAPSGTINKKRNKTAYDTDLFHDTPEYIAGVVVPAINLLRDMVGCVILTPGNRNFCLYPQPDSFGAFYQPASVGVQTFGNADAQPIFYYGKNATKKNLGKACSFKTTERAEDVDHPCPKPLAAWQKLVLNHTLPGQTILDPFCGSGTTGIICARTGRNFIGIEIVPRYAELARQMIAEAFAKAWQPVMF